MLTDQNTDIPSTQPNPNDQAEIDETQSIINIDDEDDDTPPEYFHWNGDLPTTQGIITIEFAKVPIATQIKQANEMAKFLLNNHTGDFSPLNSDKTLTPFFISAPNQHKMVRCIYGCATGLGINGIQKTQLDHHILALQGDYLPNRSYPDVLSLPYNTLHRIQVKTPDSATFHRDLANNDNEKRNHWYEACSLTNVSDITYAVPIPAYLAYDAFDRDAPITIMYERLQSTKGMKDTEYWLPLASKFLSSTMVRTSTTRKEQNARIDSVHFTGFPLEEAVTWKDQRLKFLFPSVFNPTPTPSPPPLPPSPKPQPKKETNTIPKPNDWTPEHLAAFVRALRDDSSNSSPSSSSVPTTVDEDAQKSDSTHRAGIAEIPFKKLMNMCGLAAGQEEELPELWKQLADKQLSTHNKQSIIRDFLTKDPPHPDARVPLIITVIEMIRTRNFEGGDTTSSLTSAPKGLTPFATPLLTDLKVEDINEHAHAIATATSTTVTDVGKNKIIAKIPPSFPPKRFQTSSTQHSTIPAHYTSKWNKSLTP